MCEFLEKEFEHASGSLSQVEEGFILHFIKRASKDEVVSVARIDGFEFKALELLVDNLKIVQNSATENIESSSLKFIRKLKQLSRR